MKGNRWQTPLGAGDRFTFSTTTETVCHCGGKVKIGRADDGDQPMALHSDPPCENFVRLDLLSYMRWLRQATDV